MLQFSDYSFIYWRKNKLCVSIFVYENVEIQLPKYLEMDYVFLFAFNAENFMKIE